MKKGMIYFGLISLVVFVLGLAIASADIVSIDIKPGSMPNSINVKSHGVIPVAILTTDDFDALTVDESTVMLSPDC